MRNNLQQGLRSTKPFIPPGSVNWYQPRLGSEIPASPGVTVLASLAAGGAVHGCTTLAYTCSMYEPKNSIALPYLILPADPSLLHVSINEVSCLFTVIFNEFKKHKVHLLFNT